MIGYTVMLGTFDSASAEQYGDDDNLIFALAGDGRPRRRFLDVLLGRRDG